MNPFSWFRAKPLDPLLAGYRQGTGTRVPRKTPVAELKFVVIDTETTGFDPAADRVLSIAALPVRANEMPVAGARSWLVYQSRASMTDAVRVHGILPSETRTGDPESKVLRQLLPLLTGAVIIGHHVAFDVQMLNEALNRELHTRLRNPTLDTARLAMQVVEAFRKTGYPGQRAPSLDEICTHCGITPLERHTAAGDAFTTAELFMVLCARYARQLGRPLMADDLPIDRG